MSKLHRLRQFTPLLHSGAGAGWASDPCSLSLCQHTFVIVRNRVTLSPGSSQSKKAPLDFEHQLCGESFVMFSTEKLGCGSGDASGLRVHTAHADDGVLPSTHTRHPWPLQAPTLRCAHAHAITNKESLREREKEVEGCSLCV